MKTYLHLPIAIMVVLLFGFVSDAQALNDYAGWAFAVKMTVNNPSATSTTNYPVKILVPAKTYIDAGKMNSDMRDIRFADAAG